MKSRYYHYPKACVSASNISPDYNGKSADECASLCLIHDDCKAFEYKDSGYCVLQSSSDMTGCDGIQHNYDLYVKKGTFDSIN